jgi:hypothetical protein
MKNHQTVSITLAAYEVLTNYARQRKSNRKAVASRAILAFVNGQRPRNYRTRWLTAFVLGLAIGWLVFGALLP